MKFEIDIYINNEDNSARFVLGYKKENPLIVMGVNPSTANDDTPDPTIRRVLGYMRRNGFGGFIMLNVYPQRTPYPSCLTKGHPRHPSRGAYQELKDFDIHQYLKAI